MKTFFEFIILFAIIVSLVFGGKRIGTNSENNRLYQACLEESATRTYQEAVAFCKNRVK